MRFDQGIQTFRDNPTLSLINAVNRMIGGALLFSAGYFIISNQNLKQHPYTLIALELLMHGAMYSNQDLNARVLEIPFWKTWDYTLFWADLNNEDYYYAFINTIDLSHRLYLIFLQAYLSLNVVIYCDLYLIMNNPFKPKENRMSAYLIFVLLTSLIPLSINIYLFEEGQIIY